MKNLLAIVLTLVLMIFGNSAEAQKRNRKVRKTKKVAVVKRNNVRVTNTRRVRTPRTRVVHYNYCHLPRRGAVVASVHTSAVVVRFGGVGFRLHSGVWYRPQGRNWIVTRPPYGARVRVLPTGCRNVVAGANRYHYYNGAYYAQRNGMYEVVQAPMNAEIDSLPNGYNTVSVNGDEYYELDDVYYMPSVDGEGQESLVVVENPVK